MKRYVIYQMPMPMDKIETWEIDRETEHFVFRGEARYGKETHDQIIFERFEDAKERLLQLGSAYVRGARATLEKWESFMEKVEAMEPPESTDTTTGDEEK